MCHKPFSSLPVFFNLWFNCPTFPPGLDSLLSPKQLNEHQHIRLLAVRVLCQYSDLERDPAVTPRDLPRPPDDIAPKAVKRKLEKLLDVDEWDSNKAFDLQQVTLLLIISDQLG